jgi:hypothetical protein
LIGKSLGYSMRDSSAGIVGMDMAIGDGVVRQALRFQCAQMGMKRPASSGRGCTVGG